VLAGCGGGGNGTTSTEPSSASRAEFRWGLQVEAFVNDLLPDLRRLERLTGGGPKTGAIGKRLDPRIFRPGLQRRQFEASMAALTSCGLALEGGVPLAPTERLGTVRTTLVQACTQLEQVPKLLRDEVLRASSPSGVDPGALEEAAGRAAEGVRSVVGSLATLQRLVATPPGG
jgi:hypothetical protein